MLFVRLLNKVGETMKTNPFKYIFLAVFSAMLLIIPSLAPAATEQRSTGPPPIEQQLVREGDFAVKLVFALGVGVARDEAEAESRLAEIGIMPKSGWIADYPVTPDISDEVRNSVIAAADSGKLSMSRDKAMQVFDDTLAEVGLPLAPYTGDSDYVSAAAPVENYQDPTVINNYYYTEGPPVVTYYAPPPAYDYLYSWVPYPFWTAGFLFTGFFVLNDFHRPVFLHHHHHKHHGSVFVSNHFRDGRTHKFFRIDHRSRVRGDSFVVRRGHDSRAFVTGDVRGRDSNFSDRNRTRSFNDGRTISPRSTGNREFNRSSGSSGRDTRQNFDRTRSFTPTSQGVRSFSSPSGNSGSGSRQNFDRTRNLTPSSQGVRSFSRPSGNSGSGSRQDFGRTINFSPSSQGGRSFSRPSGNSGSSPQHFRSGGMSGSQSSGSRSFSRPSSGSGGRSMSFGSGGGRSFSPSSRGGGGFSGGRGGRR
jgi:hypothetical protein